MAAPVFERQLAHGICVGVRTADVDPERDLWDEERRLCDGYAGLRLLTFTAGRVALRLALARLGVEPSAIGKDSRSAPRVPPSVRASISHKNDLAVALASPRQAYEAIGVDLEVLRPLTVDISMRILREEELPGRGRPIARDARWDSFVLERFSIKEAIYKAIDPFLHRYVGFKEVAVHEPTARFHPRPGEPELTIAVECVSLEQELSAPFIVSTARATKI